jgi:hypothetical protein
MRHLKRVEVHSLPNNPVEPNTANIGLFADIPRWVWTIFLSAWAAIFGLFVLFFAADARAAFAIAIVALFGLMAFGLPAALASQARCKGHRCREIIDVRTGPLSVKAAAAQILLIPVGAVIGLTAFIALAK